MSRVSVCSLTNYGDDNGPAHDVTPRECLICRVRLSKREPFGHDCLGPEDSLRGETDDLRMSVRVRAP